MNLFKNSLQLAILLLFVSGCKTPAMVQQPTLAAIPNGYGTHTDSTNSAAIQWNQFFTDKNLIALIDTAIKNNPDIRIALQEIEIARNQVGMKQGQILPTVRAGVGMSVDKVGRYTSDGAGDASTEITPGKLVPDPLTDLTLRFQASWEADIWGKLHTAKKAAFTKYLGSIEGKNFVMTNLVAEVANSYFELLALDNQLAIVKQAIQLQQNELEIVKVQKQAAMASELAVKQFEAQVYNSQSLEFSIQQQITENENKINFLLGRFPQKIIRDSATFSAPLPASVQIGIPSQLLNNRPDIKQKALELSASKLEVNMAKAEFYPSLEIGAAVGLRAFKPSYLFTAPESIIFSLLGDFAGPLINRHALKAAFNNANAYQLSALYEYQQAILNGYYEVANQYSNISNLEKLYTTKSKEVNALMQSISIAGDLFKSARANYLEVLIAQREALSSKLELVETKKMQLLAITNIYKALGGGWK